MLLSSLALLLNYQKLWYYYAHSPRLSGFLTWGKTGLSQNTSQNSMDKPAQKHSHAAL